MFDFDSLFARLLPLTPGTVRRVTVHVDPFGAWARAELSVHGAADALAALTDGEDDIAAGVEVHARVDAGDVLDAIRSRVFDIDRAVDYVYHDATECLASLETDVDVDLHAEVSEYVGWAVPSDVDYGVWGRHDALVYLDTSNLPVEHIAPVVDIVEHLRDACRRVLADD